jgi:4-hydroxythreonine-4-phosphate dehydrogenase
MHRAVNVTLGLPIVRTSVAHGTAFDLAWQGRAESSGMVEAIRVAARLADRRPKAEGRS